MLGSARCWRCKAALWGPEAPALNRGRLAGDGARPHGAGTVGRVGQRRVEREGLHEGREGLWGGAQRSKPAASVRSGQ